MTKPGHVKTGRERQMARDRYLHNKAASLAQNRAYRAKHAERLKPIRKATNAAYYARTRDAQLAADKGRRETRKVSKPWVKVLQCVRSRAKSKGLECALSHEWAESVWTGTCAITGLPFSADRSGKPGPKPFSPTVDRIESWKGYTPGNCRFVLACVNNFRGTMGDAEMVRVALAISMRHGGRMVEVDEAHTSQTCSACGALPEARPRGIAGLAIREWECSECGTVHDRDVNAARNILRLGLQSLAEGAA